MVTIATADHLGTRPIRLAVNFAPPEIKALPSATDPDQAAGLRPTLKVSRSSPLEQIDIKKSGLL
jgi:hypothetical protein